MLINILPEIVFFVMMLLNENMRADQLNSPTSVDANSTQTKQIKQMVGHNKDFENEHINTKYLQNVCTQHSKYTVYGSMRYHKG